MTKLRQLTINKFRNVAPTTLEFRPGINVLLGRNAAGKTTLLRLLATAVASPEDALKDDPFEVSFHAFNEELDLKQKTTRLRISETIPHTPDLPRIEEFPSLSQTDSLEYIETGNTVLSARIYPNEVIFSYEGIEHREARLIPTPPIISLIVALSNQGNSDTLRKLATQIAYSRILTAGRMDESLDRFNTLLKLELQSRGGRKARNTRVREIPHSMVNLLNEPIPDGTTATYSLAFLDRAAQVLGYNSAHARFDIERLDSATSDATVRLSNLRFFFKRANEEISHNQLSYGQKRLLAFFAHADASPDIIIADELVNGLHHEWISACLEEIGGRQAFLTSQNPLLLDFLRFDSIEEVRHTFIICERAGSATDAQLIWRNLTDDEAESFFLAYQTGIQRVSDILLTKGLW
ncbi:AAA family ATPase [Corallococcus exiguus]|uniref:ATP-binding protein n=1 Tax=Corallococcus TaxID=83461 RepID=UPI0011C3E660|nr:MULTISPECIES: ATP-binding protein [Corallococcus]NPC50059.1 AAA family ATPase [Corallococcus exiguus]